MPILPVSLTGVEVVHLIDALRNGDSVKGREDELGELRPLIQKLGQLYRFLVKPTGILPGPMIVEVTEDQVWLMRSKVRTGDMGIDKSAIGVDLSLKLYAALASFETGLSEYGIVDIADLFKEDASARAEPSQDPDPDAGADAGTKSGPGEVVPGAGGEAY